MACLWHVYTVFRISVVYLCQTHTRNDTVSPVACLYFIVDSHFITQRRRKKIFPTAKNSKCLCVCVYIRISFKLLSQIAKNDNKFII